MPGESRTGAHDDSASIEALACAVQPAVDPGNLFHPAQALRVLEAQDLVVRPVKVIGDVGYLLVQAVERVAYDTPPKLARSTSNFAWHSGHVIGMVLCPSSLMRR